MSKDNTKIDKKITSKTALRSLKEVVPMSELERLFALIDRGVVTINTSSILVDGEEKEYVSISYDWSKDKDKEEEKQGSLDL
jgi:hypothetical protein